MKKNQDKRRPEKARSADNRAGSPAGVPPAKKSRIFELTLVPFNLRSKF
jgi:hypothetical protein